MSFDSMYAEIIARFDPVKTPARKKYLSFSACEGGIENIIVVNLPSMGNWSCIYWYHPRTPVTVPLSFKYS